VGGDDTTAAGRGGGTRPREATWTQRNDARNLELSTTDTTLRVGTSGVEVLRHGNAACFDNFSVAQP